MEIKFHGQSCFELSDGETTLLIDPFLKPNNPARWRPPRRSSRPTSRSPTATPTTWPTRSPVAKRTGADCVAIVELANWLEGQGVENVSDPNLGGTVSFDWGSIKLVPAWHTNTIPGSEEAPFSAEHGIVDRAPPPGLVIKIGGKTVYHAGDTCLFGDMKLIAERDPIDVALLPIGGHYTMDRHDAVVAAAVRRRRDGDPDALRHLPADRDRRRAPSRPTSRPQTSSQVVVLKPGESHSASS